VQTRGQTPRWAWPAIGHGHRYLPVTIDHILYDGDRVGIRDYDVLELKGTDHRSLYAELVIRNGP
jgi:hypothetical protein